MLVSGIDISPLRAGERQRHIAPPPMTGARACAAVPTRHDLSPSVFRDNASGAVAVAYATPLLDDIARLTKDRPAQGANKAPRWRPGALRQINPPVTVHAEA